MDRLTDPTDAARAAAEEAARDGYGRLLALLGSLSGDLEASQDALADAFERALRTWPRDGVPRRPAAWLLTAARHRIRDRWRSAEHRRTTVLDVDRHAPVHEDDLDVLEDLDPCAVPDQRLALIFVCAHPAIAVSDRTPLMLNTVLGLTAEQIARAWSIPTATMATRLTRGRRRIAQARIPFRLPARDDLAVRTDAVLEAVYGVHAIDWAATGPEPRPVPATALHLVEVLAALLPDDAEVHGLAALVCLSTARAGARLDEEGRFVPLEEQDSARWDDELIARGRAHLRIAHGLGVLGRYQLEAAVQAVHCARRDTGTTDWVALRGLHETLHALAPSFGSTAALAAVLGRLGEPAAGLALLEGLGEGARRFQPAWAVRAHLMQRLDRDAEADAAYARAIDLTHDAAQRAYLTARRGAVTRS